MAEPQDGPALAREYYRAIDAGEYDALQAVLAPSFSHERGDRTFTGREEFLTFMAEKRPETDTTHEIERVYTGPGGVAVQGRLLHGDGTLFFRFVDVFQVVDRLTHLVTYSASP
ncbi:nuclear transport factor 2 family protein [Halodesulfurarchaeum sp. HSR-GB]|uniref:nuclear transport factor 2 family protein n=1 Tax=Halodesulfurarchaeum sp. HSR-GB TaxID=3074077 RepID=UPI00285F5D07|nr:nuclear transport factor 2 family protein [Halodesulfurarchaeum sp. HSR-GB]MDR5656315.1 nuclear transport factor 2 family protein [Halodesulfurarchaeum sp. HSR-GB]